MNRKLFRPKHASPLIGFLALILPVFFAGALEGEQAPVPVPVEFAFSGNGGFTALEREVLSRILFTELAGSDGAFVLRRTSGDDEAGVMSEMRIARRLIPHGVSGWLRVRFYRDDDSYGYRAEYIELPEIRSLFALENQDSIQSVQRNPSRLFRPLYTALREMLPEAGTAPMSDGKTASLVILAPPGTTVRGIPGRENRRIRVGPGGRGEVMLPVPALYRFSVHSFAHHSGEFTVMLDESGREIEAELEESGNTFIDLFLAGFNVPGFEWGIRFGHNRRYYAKAGGYTYLLTLVPLRGDGDEYYWDGIEFKSDRSSVFASEPLTVLNAHAGILIGPEHRLFRFYTAAGLFCRIVHSPNLFGFDPLGPFGVIGTFGVEFDSGKRVKIFLEANPSIFFTRNALHLQSMYRGGTFVFPVSGDVDGLLTFQTSRLGVRIEL